MRNLGMQDPVEIVCCCCDSCIFWDGYCRKRMGFDEIDDDGGCFSYEPKWLYKDEEEE